MSRGLRSRIGNLSESRMDALVWPLPRRSAFMKSIHFVFISICIYVLLASALALGQSNPIPLINQPLVPASAAPGGAGFTLTVNGWGFTSTAEVYWNGSLRPTTVVSSSQLQAQINASDIAQAGFGWVTVGNLGAGEVQSNVVYFPIRDSTKGVGFVPRSIQNVASDPEATAVGDFNNDGLLDFATSSGTTIEVFLGKGNGTFQPPIVINLSEIVLKMVVGDFNGDGNLDLAVVRTTFRNNCCLLQVFLGKGDGRFISPKEEGIRMRDVSNLSVADFNGDGKLDLYVGFYSGRSC